MIRLMRKLLVQGLTVLPEYSVFKSLTYYSSRVVTCHKKTEAPSIIMSADRSRLYSNLLYGWSSLMSHDCTVLPAGSPIALPTQEVNQGKKACQTWQRCALMRLERNGRLRKPLLSLFYNWRQTDKDLSTKCDLLKRAIEL